MLYTSFSERRPVQLFFRYTFYITLLWIFKENSCTWWLCIKAFNTGLALSIVFWLLLNFYGCNLHFTAVFQYHRIQFTGVKECQTVCSQYVVKFPTDLAESWCAVWACCSVIALLGHVAMLWHVARLGHVAVFGHVALVGHVALIGHVAQLGHVALFGRKLVCCLDMLLCSCYVRTCYWVRTCCSVRTCC